MPLYKDRNKNPSIKNDFDSFICMHEKLCGQIFQTIADFHDHSIDLVVIQLLA